MIFMINQAVKTITLSNFPNLNKIPELLEFLVTLYKPNNYFFFFILFKNWPIGSEETQEVIMDCLSDYMD